MNTLLTSLRAFLECAHKNGTDCNTALLYLIQARTAQPKNKEEQFELENIIAELEQVHQVCMLPNQAEEDDSSECGI